MIVGECCSTGCRSICTHSVKRKDAMRGRDKFCVKLRADVLGCVGVAYCNSFFCFP